MLRSKSLCFIGICLVLKHSKSIRRQGQDQAQWWLHGLLPSGCLGSMDTRNSGRSGSSCCYCSSSRSGCVKSGYHQAGGQRTLRSNVWRCIGPPWQICLWLDVTIHHHHYLCQDPTKHMWVAPQQEGIMETAYLWSCLQVFPAVLITRQHTGYSQVNVPPIQCLTRQEWVSVIPVMIVKGEARA